MLSILIPCYNEEISIFKNTNEIISWANSRSYKIEINLINNASTDSTLEILKKLELNTNVNVFNENKKGKGYAIKTGLLNCNFKNILILDADLSTGIEEFDDEWLNKESRLILGSRSIGRELFTPLYRKISGKVLNIIIQKIFNLNIRDTQCGFKFISSNKISKIAENITIGGFMYDLDLILSSKKENLKIIELPVVYKFDKNSSVSMFKDPFFMLFDLLKLKRKYKSNQN
jgi:glycosyltransferase involved in cell wall biosynthesis